MSYQRLLVLQLCCMLFACGNDEGDDLDRFMRDAANDMHPKIQPLPEVKPYIPLQYNADGVLVDPFQARKIKGSGAGSLQPDMSRPKEVLESYPLETLKFVGMIEKTKLKYGLVEVTDKTVQQVRVGNYIGQNFGMVTAITENGLTIKEIVQDEITGDWVERAASLELQE